MLQCSHLMLISFGVTTATTPNKLMIVLIVLLIFKYIYATFFNRLQTPCTIVPISIPSNCANLHLTSPHLPIHTAQLVNNTQNDNFCNFKSNGETTTRSELLEDSSRPQPEDSLLTGELPSYLVSECAKRDLTTAFLCSFGFSKLELSLRGHHFLFVLITFMAEERDREKVERTMTGKTGVNEDFDEEENSLNDFGVMALILEAVLITLLWIFMKDSLVAPNDALASQRYPAFQDVNVMMLIGFGFLMTFIRTYAWSAISYTFLINAYVFQIYLLLHPFWEFVMHGGWGGAHTVVSIDINTMILCSYSVGSVLISFGGIIGRVGPKDLLIIATFHIIGYSLN